MVRKYLQTHQHQVLRPRYSTILYLLSQKSYKILKINRSYILTIEYLSKRMILKRACMLLYVHKE